MAYALIDDIYALGLAARAFVAYARPFEGVDPTTGTIRLKAHGYDARDIITFEVTSGGTLPTPLSAFVPFHPLPLSSDLFKVSSTINGSALAPFSAVGSAWGVCVDPIRRLNSLLEDCASIIDDHLTAHEPPIDPDNEGKYPPVLVGINARMAARRAVTTLQVENPQYKVAIDRVFALEKMDDEMLEGWLKGKPIQPRPAGDTQNTKLENLAFARAGRAPLPWNPGRL